MIYAFVNGFLLSLSLCFDLGMVNVAIVKTGFERGFKHSFYVGFGSCFGDLIYLVLALTGFTVIFQFGIIRWVLWIAGTVILLYLSYKMVRETVRPKVITTDGTSAVLNDGVLPGPLKNTVYGLSLALSSPTAILWFAVIAGPIVAQQSITEWQTILAFILGFFAAGLVWSLFMATVSSRTGRLLGQKFVRWISFISAVLFLYFAFKIFADGLKTVLLAK
jgi:L-lysine exporter family protein LysE/ArgO